MTIPSLSSSARIGLVVALAGLMAAWAPVDTPDPIITLVTGESFQGRVVKRSSDATVYATALGE
ncbi:MAG: hypothetical protein KDB53_18230, partial [Planctomycetes bacterium]|nr:hypothetical protein [Planctomycetota bacterium]